MANTNAKATENAAAKATENANALGTVKVVNIVLGKI